MMEGVVGTCLSFLSCPRHVSTKSAVAGSVTMYVTAISRSCLTGNSMNLYSLTRYMNA